MVDGATGGLLFLCVWIWNMWRCGCLLFGLGVYCDQWLDIDKLAVVLPALDNFIVDYDHHNTLKVFLQG